jgi:hypothetical protein
MTKKKDNDSDDSEDESVEHCSDLIQYFCAKYFAYLVILTFFIFVALFSLYIIGLFRW